MSLGSWPEAAASESKAVTTAVRNKVRKNMNGSVLFDCPPPWKAPAGPPPDDGNQTGGVSDSGSSSRPGAGVHRVSGDAARSAGIGGGRFGLGPGLEAGGDHRWSPAILSCE